MKSNALKFVVLTGSLLILGACGDGNNTPAGSGSGSGYSVRPAPTTINTMDYQANLDSPVAATTAGWHAFFTAPATPGVAMTQTTDLTQLNNFQVLYISQFSIDTLSAADMATVRDWANAGGILVVGSPTNNSNASAFGDFLGASYAFTSVAGDLDNIVVTNASHRILTVPNVLNGAALSNWSQSTHGAFSSVGSAYRCVANGLDALVPPTSLPVLCATPYGSGAIIITSLHFESHDDHLTGGDNSASELFENFLGIVYTL